MYSSPMKGGSVDRVACMGCWGCSVRPLVPVFVSPRPSERTLTLFPAGCCTLAGVDVWVCKAGVGVARACWCWSVAEESSGSKVEAVGGELLWSSLLCLRMSFSQRTFGGEPGRSLLEINHVKRFLSHNKSTFWETCLVPDELNKADDWLAWLC